MIASQRFSEPIIEPDLPIVDAHHHLWFLPEAALASMERQDAITARMLAPNFRRHARYLFDEFLADVTSGHNIRASVFVDAHAMYRVDGPESMKSLGEVEFVNGVAAMAASGLFGDARICAGIVGSVDLRLGSAVEEVLAAHLQAAPSRYRGIRGNGIYDEDSTILGGGSPFLLQDPQFRAGFKYLRDLDLSLDVLLLEPQLPELIELARSFPDTRIILNHLGVPIGLGRYSGQRETRFPIWCKNIQTLARCANVSIKLAGLGLPFAGFDSYMSTPPVTSEQLAHEWKPYIDACIEAFGADRCMFGSNFPVDASVGSYALLWNAFKRLVACASQDEKTALFSRTAKRVYRLEFK